MTDELVAFLRARLDEDERVARAAAGGRLHREGDWSFGPGNADGVRTGAGTPVTKFTWPYEGAHIARWDPARVMREVDAKRRLIDEHAEVDPCDAHDSALRSIPCDTLRLLALPYADHGEFREEWRV